jgi:hypothetical protein
MPSHLWPSLLLAPSARAAAAALLLLGASGCATELVIPEVRDPAQPNVTIRYATVRSEVRLFADYSSIGASILDDAAAGARPAEPPR